jgi:hypothetical protein
MISFKIELYAVWKNKTRKAFCTVWLKETVNCKTRTAYISTVHLLVAAVAVRFEMHFWRARTIDRQVNL